VNISSILKYFGSYINVIQNIVDTSKNVFDLYLLTEYSEFPSLEKFRIKNPSFEKDIFYNICINFYNAIKEMHGKGIIHMDIKPDNILVNPETGDVILIDFGAACNCFNKCNEGNTDKMTIENRIIRCFRKVFGEQTVSPMYLHFRINKEEIQKLMNKDKSTENITTLLKDNDLWAYGICIYYLFYGKNTLPYKSSKYRKSFADVYAAYDGQVQAGWESIINTMNKEFTGIDKILNGSGVPTMSKLLPLKYDIIT